MWTEARVLAVRQLVFDEEDHVAVFADYAIYDYRLRGGTNAVERLWKLGEVNPGTPAHEVLEAMQTARFTVVRVVEVLRGIGAVVDDLFCGEQRILADIVLSENSVPGLTMAARLLTFPDFVMTTGAGFHVEAETIKKMVALLARDAPEGSSGIRSLSEKDQSWLAAMLIQNYVAPEKNE